MVERLALAYRLSTEAGYGPEHPFKFTIASRDYTT